MKFDFAAILIAATVGGVIWIEREHRVVIDAPAIDTASLAAACPHNDAVPYPPRCIAYLEGRSDTDLNRQATAGSLFVAVPQ
jgi:hypothetical protein